MDRRDFLKISAGAAGVALIGPTTACSGEDAEQAGASLGETASKAAIAAGYESADAGPLITGDAFNGGLRYDESHVTGPAKRFAVLGCARVEDLTRGNDPERLPYFHMIGLMDDAPDHHGENLEFALKFLTDGLGLDSDRLSLVSTSIVDPYVTDMAERGLKPPRISYRDYAEAYAAGDGSGYFRPADHPHTDGFPTASIHFDKDGTDLELGEFSLHDSPQSGIVPEMGSLGLERIEMALGRTVPTFEDARRQLLADIQKEADETGAALPAAYSLIADPA